MRLFIDVDKNVVLQGSVNAVTGIESYVAVKKGYIVGKRGGSMVFKVYPVHSDMLPALVDSRLIFGIKKAGVFDGDYLAGAVAMKGVDEKGVMCWGIEVVFSSSALDSALCVDSDAKNDLASVDCGAELSWQMEGNVASSSSVFPVVIQNNINRDLEPPPALLPTYPLATEIALRADLAELSGSWDGGNVTKKSDFRSDVDFWSKVSLRGEVCIYSYSSDARLKVQAPAAFDGVVSMAGNVRSAGGISFSAPSGSYVKLSAGGEDKLCWGGAPVAMLSDVGGGGGGAWDGGIVNSDATFKGAVSLCSRVHIAPYSGSAAKLDVSCDADIAGTVNLGGPINFVVVRGKFQANDGIRIRNLKAISFLDSSETQRAALSWNESTKKLMLSYGSTSVALNP